MKLNYTILQIKRPTYYMFMSYNYAMKHNFSLDDYEEVYKSSIYTHNDNLEETLESIFVQYNIMKPPEDFKGHSLSVSDIIKLEDGRMFYVNGVGFEEIK